MGQDPNTPLDAATRVDPAAVAYDGTTVLENGTFRFHAIGDFQAMCKANWKLRIHSFIALGISLTCFIIWLCTQFASYGKIFPWFIFPLDFCFALLAFHYFIFAQETREWLTLHISLFVLLNSGLFVIWSWADSTYLWFLPPLFSTGLFLGLHASLKLFSGNPHRGVYTHAIFFVILNLLVYSCGQSSEMARIMPIVLCGLGLPLIIHATLHFHKKNYWLLHFYSSVDIQSMLFFIWLFSAHNGAANPWFVFPVASLLGLLLLHYFISRRRMANLLPTTTTDAPSSKSAPTDSAANVSYDFSYLNPSGASPPPYEVVAAPPVQVQVLAQPALYPQASHMPYSPIFAGSIQNQQQPNN